MLEDNSRIFEFSIAKNEKIELTKLMKKSILTTFEILDFFGTFFNKKSTKIIEDYYFAIFWRKNSNI